MSDERQHQCLEKIEREADPGQFVRVSGSHLGCFHQHVLDMSIPRGFQFQNPRKLGANARYQAKPKVDSRFRSQILKKRSTMK